MNEEDPVEETWIIMTKMALPVDPHRSGSQSIPDMTTESLIFDINL